MPLNELQTEDGRWRLIGSGTSPEEIAATEHFDSLMAAAREVRLNAYSPYSKFAVGAAVLMGGRIYAGCNVENASYGGTICAERSAIFAGVANGHQVIDAVAVTTGALTDTPLEARSPCGLCRQVISEFATNEVPILLDREGTDHTRYLGDIIPFGQLHPWGFSLDM
tara:strand:- start:1626 stop:2126 length:501 start_codon:yes stop_codon:yes gene_type:complete